MPESLVGEGLVIDEQLPVAWAPGTTDEAGLARLNVDNHQLLMADATLDEVRIHDVLKDESPALVHELQRLDYKLNLLLRLTAELAMRQNGLPQKRRVRLSATGLVWPGEDAPEKGSTGLLMLYMNPALPQPLKIAATASDASQNGAHRENDFPSPPAARRGRETRP